MVTGWSIQIDKPDKNTKQNAEKTQTLSLKNPKYFSEIIKAPSKSVIKPNLLILRMEN